MAISTREFYLLVDTSAVMKEVSDLTTTQLSQAMGRWSKAIEEGVINARYRELAKIHRQVAREARDAIYAEYQASGIGKTPSYRWDDPEPKLRRYSHGAMERALKNQRFIIGDDLGIGFIDMELMDSMAKQWYRLNFGAVPAGTGTRPAEGSMTFFGKSMRDSRFSLRRFGPSEGFYVPNRGWAMWSSTPARSGTSRPLTPLGRGAGKIGMLYLKTDGMRFSKTQKGTKPARFFKDVPSRGIKGKHFLEAGSRVINNRYPRLIEGLVREWERKGARAL